MKKIKTMSAKNLYAIFYVKLKNEEGESEKTLLKVYAWTSRNGEYKRYYCLYSQICKNADNTYGAIQLFCAYGDFKEELQKKYGLNITVLCSTGVSFV